MKNFLDLLKEKIVVFDGAMGSNLQGQDLTIEDWGGANFENCSENLLYTKPEAIEKVHLGFLEIGCDVIETNSFGGSEVVLQEFGIAEKTYDVNRKAAELAKRLANDFSTANQPRFVAGSIGPGTKLPTLGHITYADLKKAYATQVHGLIDGGSDLLIVETCQDILQTKAALAAIFEFFEKNRFKIPVIAQVTIETFGTMLNGTEIAAALTALEPFPIDVIGMNCGTGPKQMAESLKYLCEIHTASNRSVPYGDLLERAARITPSANPKLKDPKDFKIIGKNMPRLDTPSKVNGSGVFGIDVKVEGMLTATVLRCPVFEGKVKLVDDSAAKAVKGVRAVVPLEYGVGVVADNYWAAKKGRDKLKVEWDGGKFANVSSEGIYQTYAEAANNEKGLEAKKVGDANAAKSKAAKTVEAVYFAPYLSHATMEPMNFTADVRADGCELWGGIQGQLIIQKVVAQTLGFTPEKVKVNTTLLGGGFGRRIGLDYVMDAVLLSKSVGKPVKVVWSREDDMQHDYYRPATYNKMSAGIDANGKPVFWEHRLVNPSIMAPLAPIVFGFSLPPTQVDDSSVEGASTLPYDFPNLQVDWIRKDTGIPVGFWRSVGSSHTAFSTECFLDEVAAAAKTDPYQFRLSLLEKHPRHKGALTLAATKAGWGKPLAKGIFQGIAVHESFGSYVAQVAEVSVDKDGNVKVHRVVCAIDCGQVVNPDTVIAQMEGSIIFGLTAALYGEITIKDGRVEQKNFYDYKMLRMNETPRIEVYIVPSTEKHGGVGEPGTPPIAPAVVNAIFAATGKRIRQLPIRAEDLKKSSKEANVK